MMGHTRSGYGPSLVVGISGAALLLFGILASTDAGTVGGVTLGAMIVGAGAMLSVDTWRTRRWRQRAWGATEEISDRTLRSIQARQDRSEEIRAARRADR